MPVIGQQAFIAAPTSDKYLSLANEEYVRQLDMSAVGNAWSKIRIAIECAFTNTGGGDLTDCKLFVGLCSGTQYPFQSQQCRHAVGYIWGHWNTLQNATYVANAGLPYYSGGLSYYGLRKVGQAIDSATIGSATWMFPATGGTLERRGFVCCDITSAATQVFPGGRTGPTTVGGLDCYYEQFLYDTQQAGASFYVLEQVCANNTQTLSPGAGWNTTYPLDTVDIFWESASYAIRIYAITVCIVA